MDRWRFRPNVVIEGAEGLAEVEWPGLGLRAGDVLIGVRNRRTRCVMTTFDPDTLDQDSQVLRRIVQEFGGAAEVIMVASGGCTAAALAGVGRVAQPPGNGTDAWTWDPRGWRPQMLS